MKVMATDDDEILRGLFFSQTCSIGRGRSGMVTIHAVGTVIHARVR
jgi:hypothetical protein